MGLVSNTCFSLSLGSGGIATLLTLLNAQIPVNAQYAVIVLTSLSATALSGFIIHGLQGIKTRGKTLFDTIAPQNSAERIPTEKIFGSELRASRLAKTAQVSAILAIATNGAMLATTVARTATGNTALLPLGLLIANASLTSGSNLAGFFLFSLLGARNELLLAEANQNKLGAEKETLQSEHDKAISRFRSVLEHKDQEIATLTEQITLQKTLEAAPPISSSEPSFTVTIGLFGRRLSASARPELPLAQQQTACSALTDETGASTGNEPAVKR